MIEQELISFATVLVVAIVIACAVSTLYAFGIRLWARGTAETEGGTHLTFRLAAGVCFAACIVIVLFALWLMIPAFH